MTLSTSAVKQDVVNIVHPRGVPLHEVYTAINGVVGHQMQIVPFEQWVRDVEALSSSTSNSDAEAYVSVISFQRDSYSSNISFIACYQTADVLEGPLASQRDHSSGQR